MADTTQTVPLNYAMSAQLQGENKQEPDDLKLTLCELDLAPYHRTPERYAMSKDVIASLCGANKKEMASALLESTADQLQPAGFVFHESRVGSTLVANMLASLPTHLVYSEPEIPMSVMIVGVNVLAVVAKADFEDERNDENEGKGKHDGLGWLVAYDPFFEEMEEWGQYQNTQDKEPHTLHCPYCMEQAGTFTE